MSIYDKASLVLIPSGTKTSKVYSQKPVSGDGDFTFSRSTAATRVNADGNIEKETQNLLLHSNTFSNTWTNASSTETSGQAGYDGTNNAWLLTSSLSGGRISQSVSVSGVQTFSVYLKAGSRNWGLLVSTSTSAYFDLVNGVVGSGGTAPIDANIESVGGGWYRCSISANGSNAEVRIYPALADNDVSGTGSIYMQDAQLEQGLVARDYIETTTAAVEGGITDNVPRLDYTDSSCPALLLEPQRTNSFSHSEYFGAWSLSRASAFGSGSVLNDTTSPEGVVNAAYIQQASGQTTTGGVFLSSLFATGTYSLSVFAKAKEQRYLRLGGAFAASGSSLWCNFDLQDGIAGTPDSGVIPSIEPLTDGWYRCSITATKVDTTGQNIFIYQANSLNGSDATPLDGLYIYGATLEQGSYATSYIPTYGTSVTRGADSCSKTGVSDIIGSDEGVIFIDIKTPSDIQLNTTFSIGGGISSEYAQLEIRTDLSINWRYRQGGTDYINANVGSYAAGDRLKLAFAYKNGDSILYKNGSSIATDTGSINSNTWDEVRFSNFAGTGKLEASVNQALLFPTRLSNAELADLTTL